MITLFAQSIAADKKIQIIQTINYRSDNKLHYTEVEDSQKE